MTSTWNVEPEEEYLKFLTEQRYLYSWVLVKYGKYSKEIADQVANEFYAFEERGTEYRGLVFHDDAWHWAMLKLFGEQYWLEKPEYEKESEEYEQEYSKITS